MTYNPSQQEVIDTFVQRAKRKRASPRVAKALMLAGRVESNFTNLPGGDASSTGPLQQQDNGAWGSPNEPVATDADQFLDAAIKANRGFHGSAGQLAQSVQRSAFPGRYDEHSSEADSILSRLGLSSAPNASNASSIASTLPGARGVTQVASQAPSVYDVIRRYDNATTPQTPDQGSGSLLSSPYDPVASGTKISDTVERIKALRAPAQQALQTGNAVTSGIGANKDAPAAVAQLIEEADKIDSKQMPYVWGGGHAVSGKADRGTGRDPGIGLDCSGAVSAVLGIDPRVSGAFEKWGDAGEGKNVTVYANGEHVLMKINGHFFGTSGSNPGGGAGWIPQKAISKEYLSRFTRRHPKGM